MLAVDLSLTSLAYAKRKTRELDIGNIEYRQADILALGSIAERFDVIECSGVLHHLEDPVAGWRILCSLLRPSGVMRIGLYSEIARRHVVRAREFVASEGFAPTPDGIRACRTAIRARGDDPLLARVARGEDFYSLSGCRDLVFHVQEQRFTLPQIAGLIERLGLQFIGFEFPDAGAAASYRARFPDDRASRGPCTLARARNGCARHLCADVPVLGAQAGLKRARRSASPLACAGRSPRGVRV